MDRIKLFVIEHKKELTLVGVGVLFGLVVGTKRTDIKIDKAVDQAIETSRKRFAVTGGRIYGKPDETNQIDVIHADGHITTLEYNPAA